MHKQELTIISRCVIAALVCFTQYVSAQFQAPDEVYLSPGFGFLVPHRPELRALVTGHSQALVAGAMYETRNAKHQKTWHRRYRFPAWGVEVYHSDVGNRRQLGTQTGVSTIMRLPAPFLSHTRFRVASLWGIGMGYSTGYWDMIDNPKAIALSSRINICLTAGYQTSYDLSRRVVLDAVIRMTHLSNGALRLPNLGTNNLTAHVGMRYAFRDDMAPVFHEDDEPRALEADHRKPKMFVSVATGAKEPVPHGGAMHFVHSLSVGVHLKPTAKTGFLMRSDFWYNMALTPLLERNAEHTPQPTDRIQQGLSLGVAKQFGKTDFQMHMGAYLYTRYKGHGLFYHRFMFTHRVNAHLSALVALQTHWARAHHPELGLMYRF